MRLLLITCAEIVPNPPPVRLTVMVETPPLVPEKVVLLKLKWPGEKLSSTMDTVEMLASGGRNVGVQSSAASRTG